MNMDINALIESVAGQAPWLIALIAVASLLEAGLGLGAIVPGETIVVLGSAVLGTTNWGWVLLAVVLVAIGASLGDHLGWYIGRKIGPPLRNSRVVASMGVENWDKAMEFVDRQGIFPLVLGRQLPGVRTLVSAACGAARIPYPRFLTASVIGSSVWAIIWCGGGALFGRVILDYLAPILPWVIVAWILFIIGFVTYRQVKSRRRRKRASGVRIVSEDAPK